MFCSRKWYYNYWYLWIPLITSQTQGFGNAESLQGHFCMSNNWKVFNKRGGYTGFWVVNIRLWADYFSKLWLLLPNARWDGWLYTMINNVSSTWNVLLVLSQMLSVPYVPTEFPLPLSWKIPTPPDPWSIYAYRTLHVACRHSPFPSLFSQGIMCYQEEGSASFKCLPSQSGHQKPVCCPWDQAGTGPRPCPGILIFSWGIRQLYYYYYYFIEVQYACRRMHISKYTTQQIFINWPITWSSKRTLLTPRTFFPVLFQTSRLPSTRIGITLTSPSIDFFDLFLNFMNSYNLHAFLSHFGLSTLCLCNSPMLLYAILNCLLSLLGHVHLMTIPDFFITSTVGVPWVVSSLGLLQIAWL